MKFFRFFFLLLAVVFALPVSFASQPAGQSSSLLQHPKKKQNSTKANSLFKSKCGVYFQLPSGVQVVQNDASKCVIKSSMFSVTFTKRDLFQLNSDRGLWGEMWKAALELEKSSGVSVLNSSSQPMEKDGLSYTLYSVGNDNSGVLYLCDGDTGAWMTFSSKISNNDSYDLDSTDGKEMLKLSVILSSLDFEHAFEHAVG